MYYFKKIKFDNIEVLLKLYKKLDRSKADVLALFAQEDNRITVNVRYDEIRPITVNEVLTLPNAEQRMIALTVFSPEEFISQINAELMDEQVVKKNQIRWDDALKPYEYTYEDVYSLYKVSSFELGLEYISKTASIYFVKCRCISTGKIYYLYVPETVALQSDAIEAIAWTYRFDNKPLSKQQYLNMIYSET